MAARDIYIPPQRIGIRVLDASEAAHANALAHVAIAAFDLDGYTVTDLVRHSNVTARLVSGTGPALALRLRRGPSVDSRTELAWLSAVRRGTNVCVLEPYAEEFDRNTRTVANRDGTPVECSLFFWADGRPLAADLTRLNYCELGRMTARLHEFASSWQSAPGLKPLVWDRTMYYAGTRLVITDPRYAEFIPAQHARVVESVVAEADAELGRLARAPDRMFLHGNIEMWNVLSTGPGELRLLDFEDVMVGSPVLDVAITLFYGRERPDYTALAEAYEAGYRSVRPWPVRDSRQLALLTAARAVMLLNHALLTERDRQSVTDRLLPLILGAAR
ncbi:phosphotransferase enzyme family protein [Streptomyces sp. NPDC096142]|uniref:phosphotransferase enzyme family protein n=1 Tax=Streptomyces sp. NPDC096142 TaxID=3366077 RepID=UPI00380698BE